MTTDARAEIGVPSAFFVEHLDTLVSAAAHGRVLDVACGRGRHALAASDAGLDVLAIDRNAESLALLERACTGPSRVETRAVDLEADAPPHLDDALFGAVVVTRYLHRPLAPWLADQIAPGGVLLYETFTTEQRALGWGPSRDAFLLEPGELPGLFPTLEPIVFEEGPSRDAKPAETARLLARRAETA